MPDAVARLFGERILRRRMARGWSTRDLAIQGGRRDRRGRVRELSNELRVKMIRNAVSAPVATMLGSAVVEALR